LAGTGDDNFALTAGKLVAREGRGASFVTGDSDDAGAADGLGALKVRPEVGAESSSGAERGCDEDCGEVGATGPSDFKSCSDELGVAASDAADAGETGDETGETVPTGLERPLGSAELACERVESEPGSKRAQEARVKNEILRFRRDALALRKRSVQLSRNWDEGAFTSGRREFGAGVSTIASPLIFGGAA
jgi:hypothetical protein